MARGIVTSAKGFTMALVMLGASLAVLWFVLHFLQTRFSGNFIGKSAGVAGEYATGQKYQF